MSNFLQSLIQKLLDMLFTLRCKWRRFQSNWQYKWYLLISKNKFTHFTPHPITSHDTKVREQWLKQFSNGKWETLGEYIKDSTNPRWAAHFLVRDIAKGLSNSERELSNQLWDLAQKLSETKRK